MRDAALNIRVQGQAVETTSLTLQSTSLICLELLGTLRYWFSVQAWLKTPRAWTCALQSTVGYLPVRNRASLVHIEPHTEYFPPSPDQPGLSVSPARLQGVVELEGLIHHSQSSGGACVSSLPPVGGK